MEWALRKLQTNLIVNHINKSPMIDPTSQSNYLQIATAHIAFDWIIDFQQKVLRGSAVHHLSVKTTGVSEVIFDTADLHIQNVEVAGKQVTYVVKAKHPVMGCALHIPLPSSLESGTFIEVKIHYQTTADGTALQWLEKEQTQGKTFPYLFSQCQPIYARSVVPCQDTPSVKLKYSARVSSILPVLLSAIRLSPPSDGPVHDGKILGKDIVTYVYDQPIPIPSYLIAIAVGNVRYRAFPQYEDKEWKSGVWAEPEMIDSSYWEFSEDTTRFLAAEEKLVTSYKFGVYDLLVLPNSFPYGGMENACLSFLTPTLLAGDRSLVDVVVHEVQNFRVLMTSRVLKCSFMTHSYFGNGVTHANASHFWLNEGWTTYIERVMQEVLHSPAERGFSFLIGHSSLVDALKVYENRPKYQRLIIDFEIGEDPDDAYSTIPYEKGANLILHLERTLGGLDVFLPYVKDYVNTYMGKSITSDQWKSHLYSYFTQHGGEDKVRALNSVDWDAWFYGEGLELPVKMEYETTLALQAFALAERWDASRSSEDLSQFKGSDLESFSSNQKVVFLERLRTYSSLPSSHIFHLATLYHLSTTNSTEIRLRFYAIALRDPSSSAAKCFALDAAKWVVGDDGTGALKGRAKFCRPMFKAISEVDKSLARDFYGRFKEGFHPIARKMIEKDLGIV